MSLSSIHESLLCIESTGQGIKEFAATRLTQMANVELNMEDVNLFLCVAFMNTMFVWIWDDNTCGSGVCNEILTNLSV